MHQIYLGGIYRTYNTQVAEYNFFASTHGIFYRIDHILGQKQNINKFKKTDGFNHLFWPQCYRNRNQLQEKENHKKIQIYRRYTPLSN